MKQNWLIWAGIGLLAYLFLKKKGAVATPVDIGRVESVTTTQDGATEVLQKAIAFTRANEAPEIAKLRADIGNRGLSVRSCFLYGQQKWCTLSNGWAFPSSLLLDYFQLKEPVERH